MKPTQLLAAFDHVCQDVLEQASMMVQEEARNTDLFHASSGFQQAITYGKESKYVNKVTSEKPWSSYLEFGNPYEGFIIRPKNAKALHFFIGGQEIFSKTSTAHGPLPFMERAAYKTNQNIHAIWDVAFARYFK